LERSTVIATLLVLLGFTFSTPAVGNLWTGAGGDNLWNNVDNWSQGVVPINATSHPGTGWDDPTSDFYPLTPDTSDDGPLWNNDVKLQDNGTVTLVDDSVGVASAYGVRVGNGGATNILQITGGRLDIGIDPNVDPSVNNVGWHLQVGRGYPGFDGGPINADPTATVLMSGGVVSTNGLLIPEQFVNHSLPDPTDSAPLNGELIMSGGIMNARWMNLGQLKGNGRAELSGDAIINLTPNVPGNPNNGGHLIFNRNWFLNGQPVPSTGNVQLDIRDNAIINIFGNRNETKSTPDASELAVYQSYIDSGELTADNDTDDPTVFLDTGIIKICALDADFDSDCDTDETDLAIWQAGYGTTGAPGDLKSIGDADNDGDVDGADLLELQIEYGTGVRDDPPSALAAVPEPTSLALAQLVAIALAAQRPRRANRPNSRISIVQRQHDRNSVRWEDR
jgi:hypothetical protein